ncbi:MAG TPA: sensor domain-containing diguanylate cyclase [Thermoanaerobaculia bacterium]|nr:sensor domain-containing diguanylate cyclase [Thermoanaerobaculia bacterium]
MTRATLFHWWKVGCIALAILLLGIAVVTQPTADMRTALVFAALVLVAAFLRIEMGDASIGFEAAVVFGAIVIFHSPAVALVSVLVGTAAHAAYLAAKVRAWRLEPFYNAAQLALSYSIVGLLYSVAVAGDAKPAAKMAGFTLLLVGYVGVHLLFVSVRRYFEEDAAPIDVRRILFLEGKTLLFVTPVVAIEIMLYASWGIVGFAIAFVPVLILAYVMRANAESSQQNVELLRRNRELAILTESSTQILSAETDHETLRRLMSLLSKLARMKACAVVTWESNPDVPGTVYRFGECMPTDQEIMRWVDSAGFAQSAPSRVFVFQSDMRKFPLSSGSAIQVLIGIQTPEVIYGILLFETEDLSILKTGSLNLLTLLVNQTALSLQDQLLRREMREKTIQLESHAATMSTILDVSNSLIGQFEIDAALTRIAHAIRKALGFESVVFALRDPRRDEYVRRAHAGLEDVWDDVRKKPVAQAEIAAFFNPEFKASNSYFVSHTALHKSEHDFFVRPEDADDGFLKPDEWHENDLLLVPLMRPGANGDEMLGFLSVRDPHDRRIPNLEKVQTLEIFATQAVTALQSSRQYEEIKRLTFIDALTPAYNHRFFQEALSKEISRHSRTGHELALAMLDLDNFKKINDTYGHPVGDEILKGLVEELMSNARDSDVVARYGGEEFAIIFPDTPGHSAHEAANRMREIVERREFVLPQAGRSLRVTVSIGVAVYPNDGLTPADLISRADMALYWAKKHGKNRVAMASEVAVGVLES